MRTIESIQEERSKASSLATIALVKITTYLDRDALTEGDVFYVSDRSLWYKYGTGSAIRFDPWLLRLNDLSTEMTHMQSAAAGDLISKNFSLTLSNSLWPADASGDRVIELLRANYPLEMATVEVSQLLVPRYFGYYPQELSDYAGTEHTVFYRGKVSRLGPITGESIQIQCTTDSPEITWSRAEDATKADPQDLGTRYPKIYGQKKKQPLVAEEVGWATTLAEAIDTSTGSYEFTDLTGIPDAGGSGYIGSEKITWTGKTGNVLAVSVRGVGATVAAAHQAGELLVELIATATFIVADHEVSAIDEVYAINPFNNELTRITTAYGTTLTAPAKVTFSQAQMELALAEMAAGAAVTQQPARSTDVAIGHVVEQTDFQQPTSGSSNMRDGNITTYTQINNTDGEVMTFTDPGDVQSQTIRVYIVFSDCDMTVNAGGVIGTVPRGANAGWYSFFTTNDDDTIAIGSGATGTFNHIGEVERFVTYIADDPTVDTQPQVAQTGGTQVQITAASMGFGLRPVADVDGAVVPDPGTEWEEVYDLDDDGGWSVSSGVTRTTDVGVTYPGSSASQKLELDFTVQVKCESADTTEAAQWTTDDAEPADEGTIKTEGASGVKGTSTSSSDIARIKLEGFSPIDLVGAPKLLLAADVRINRNGGSNDDYIWFHVGSSSSAYELQRFAVSDFDEDTWYTVLIDYEAMNGGGPGGADYSAVDYFGVSFNNGTSKVVGFLCYIDNIRTIPSVGRAQRNSISPTLDMESDTDAWRFALRVNADAKESFVSVTAYFDNSASSGVTLPSPVSFATIASADFGAADAWVLDASSESGAGDENAVQTIQLYFALDAPKLMAQNTGSLIVYADTIQAQQYLADNYDAAPGALIEKPTDIFVHWCEVVGGVAVDTTSLAAALTNLGANILAVDMRTLTPGDWKQGLAGLGFLSRANMIPEETAAGTVYKMLTAESDYDFPAADEALTVWEEFSEGGILEREVWTRFTCLYDFNAATTRGNEEAYEGFLKASEDGTDLSNPTLAEMTSGVTKYGNMEAAPLFFNGIGDEATAKDVFGYTAHESIRAPRIFLFDGCAWWEVYRWEVGDVKKFTHPWSGVEVKFRILGYDKIFSTEANTLRCIEVE